MKYDNLIDKEIIFIDKRYYDFYIIGKVVQIDEDLGISIIFSNNNHPKIKEQLNHSLKESDNYLLCFRTLYAMNKLNLNCIETPKQNKKIFNNIINDIIRGIIDVSNIDSTGRGVNKNACPLNL